MKRYIFFMLLCVMQIQAMDKIIMPLARAIGTMNYFGPKVVPCKCYFDKLPLEVRGKIAKTLFNAVIFEGSESKKYIDQKKLEAYQLNNETSLFLRAKIAREFSDFQQLFQQNIGGKKIPAIKLFVRSGKERRAFENMVNYSIFSLGSAKVDDYEIIKKIDDPDINDGLELEVNYLSKNSERLLNIGAGCIIVGLSARAVMNDCCYWVCAIPTLSIATGFSVIGLYRFLNGKIRIKTVKL